MLSARRRTWVRRGLVIAVAGLAAVAALAAWRSPGIALVRLKLALDRHDLAAVERVVDVRALTDAALARLVEERPGEVERVRLAIRGRGGWLPAITSARDYLRVRLGHTLERLVEDPDYGLHVSWSDLRSTLGTLERSGATASFVFRDASSHEYRGRMRRTVNGWRVVSVERDGEQAVLRPLTPAAEPPGDGAPATASGGNVDPPRAAADAAGLEGGPAGEERFAMLLDETAVVPRSAPAPRVRRPARRPQPGNRPFARLLDAGTWSVQVASTTDAIEADVQREWFSDRGEPAFVVPAEVRGRTWQRVMVGRYPSLADAERTATRLGEQIASATPR